MKIVIPGKPISKMRPRLGRNCVYDPQEHWKKVIKNCLISKVNESPSSLISTEAVSVDFIFYFSPSKSLSKAKRSNKLSNVEPCLVKNDLDNLEKFYCDCANGVLFEDDHQIVKMSSRKLWSEQERVEMTIEPYEGYNG